MFWERGCGIGLFSKIVSAVMKWYFFYESVSKQDVLKNVGFIVSNNLKADTILIDMGKVDG